MPTSMLKIDVLTGNHLKKLDIIITEFHEKYSRKVA